MEKKDNKVKPYDIVKNIFSLRSNFIIIGLTGRTGSGCTTVADILKEKDFDDLKIKYKLRHEGTIDNDARKRRIVYNFIRENWRPFTIIKASDVIYHFAFKLDFDQFIDSIASEWTNMDELSKQNGKSSKDNDIETIKVLLNQVKDEYNRISAEVGSFNKYLESEDYKKETNIAKLNQYADLVLKKIPDLRNKIEVLLSDKYRGKIPELLQNWGDNIRQYKDVISGAETKDGPEALATLINSIIKLLRQRNKLCKEPTRIVIDSLRNPFEIHYFRERWSSFYCVSVNTQKNVRHDKLMKYRYLTFEEVVKIDKREEAKKHVSESFRKIDIDV